MYADIARAHLLTCHTIEIQAKLLTSVHLMSRFMQKGLIGAK